MSRRVLLLVGALVWLGPARANAQDLAAEMLGAGVHDYFAAHYREAHEKLTAAINVGQKDPRPYYFRGLCYLNLGRDEDARRDFIEGANREVKDPDRAFHVAKLLERVQGSQRLLLEGYRLEARIVAMRREEELRKRLYGSQAPGSGMPPAPAAVIPAPPGAPGLAAPVASGPAAAATPVPGAETPAAPGGAAAPAPNPFAVEPAQPPLPDKKGELVLPKEEDLAPPTKVEKPAEVEPVKTPEIEFGGGAEEKPAKPKKPTPKPKPADGGIFGDDNGGASKTDDFFGSDAPPPKKKAPAKSDGLFDGGGSTPAKKPPAKAGGGEAALFGEDAGGLGAPAPPAKKPAGKPAAKKAADPLFETE